MNSLLDADIDQHRETHHGADREISLGTATILGIFFALALVCATFFGFGYSLGRKSGQSAVVPVAVAPGSTSISVKPAAGSRTGEPTTAAPIVPVTGPGAAQVSPAKVSVPIETQAPVAGDKLLASQATASGNPQPVISPAGGFMVQIAAVSSQEIADIEVTALKKYGFDVIVRHEPQDQLLHVQVGPYATRKDAEAMRQNILAHGFNAIVK